MTNLAKRGAAKKSHPEKGCWDSEDVPSRALYTVFVYMSRLLLQIHRFWMAHQKGMESGTGRPAKNHSPVWFDWGQVGVHPCSVGAQFGRIRVELDPCFRTSGARIREGRLGRESI